MEYPAKYFIASFLLMTVIPLLPAAEKFAPEHLDFFEKKIRPMLSEHCYKCHSASSKKLKASLYLDTRAGMLEGGDTGPSVVPGNPEKSLLIEVIRYTDTDMEMPPKSKLPDAVIADFVTWVESGAAWPAEAAPSDGSNGIAFDLEKRKSDHWCWKPLAPAPRKPGFIDQLIGEKLKDAKLRPAPHAEPVTLLRRLTFDLTGLPPTVAEIEAFTSVSVQDQNAAIEAAVDRLLASPHFGERWGRHWLDLMRYAESHGHEFDYPIKNAHQYRDYVIRALNADVPYDQFVAEHIAGDLLPLPRFNPHDQTNESIIATGFWYLGEAVHSPTDVRKDEADRIDNMVDTFSKSFLGLSVACARCHDHKFDAISTDDYYALTGFLQSTRRNEHKQDPGKRIANGIAKIDKISATGNQKIKRTTTGTTDLPDGLILPNTSRWFPSGHAFGNSPIPALSWSPVKNTITEHSVYDSGRYGDKFPGVLRTPTFEINGDRVHLYVKGNAQVRLIIDGYFMQVFNGLLFGGTRKDIKTGDKWQWVTLSSKDIAQKSGHKAYLEIIDSGTNSIAVKAISTSREIPKIEDYLTANPRAKELEAQFASKLSELSDAAKKISDSLPNPAATILSVTEGTPENDYVHIRGSHKNLGKEIPRRFLTALGGEAIAPSKNSSGRLELAEQVASRDNPLTARVAANRIWHHLFGRGIVPTVDDFGPMGIAPSNPRLLDSLAASLIENKWSQKELIRQIVLSETYRQSATPHPDLSLIYLADTDPENILLHKAPVRRLQAEAIRDSMLAISGRLDPKLFGNPVPVHLTTFMQGRGRPKSGPLDGAGRRSIYTSIRRNFLPPMMLAFDMPSPFSSVARRTVSNVPAQALTLMNDPFVVSESRRWADSTSSIKDDKVRIETMFKQALARPPSPEQLKTTLTWIQSHPSRKTAWQDFAHSLWNTKEFIFLN
ncbi:MAG: PSD1 and planctomycete cytochrome C domain-containing protein [Akkermansiaceae bacterium]